MNMKNTSFLLVAVGLTILSACGGSKPDAETWQNEWTIVVNAEEKNLDAAGHHPMGWISGELDPGFINRPHYEGAGTRIGLLALHPLSGVEPAKIRFNGDISLSAPVLVVEASGNVNGDALLQCVVNGEKIGEVVVDGSQWTKAEYDLSEFVGMPLVLELWNAAGGTKSWSFEHCYTEYI